MRTQSVYEALADPGHAWVKVKREELRRLEIAWRVTRYSYQRGEYVYLEEDCDLSLFMQAKAARGEPVTFRERFSNRESRVRSYSPYTRVECDMHGAPFNEKFDTSRTFVGQLLTPAWTDSNGTRHTRSLGWCECGKPWNRHAANGQFCPRI